MKKGFKAYAICWAILFAAFNVISFAALAGMEKVGGSFWIGYAFIDIAFIGQLACAYFAFKAANMQKLFYNISLISVSYSGLVMMLVFGGLVMLLPNIPEWVGIIVCTIILAFNAIAVIKASAAAEIVSEVDEKVKAQTQFIKMTTVNAQNIMNRAKSEAAKAECKKVYEALRYSDPMSSDALSVEEAMITLKMGELAAAVGTDNIENITAAAGEIVLLVSERNNKCKALK